MELKTLLLFLWLIYTLKTKWKSNKHTALVGISCSCIHVKANILIWKSDSFLPHNFIAGDLAAAVCVCEIEPRRCELPDIYPDVQAIRHQSWCDTNVLTGYM